MGFLEWAGYSAVAQVDDGADSYLIRDGRIVVQIIHYALKPLLDPQNAGSGSGNG